MKAQLESVLAGYQRDRNPSRNTTSVIRSYVSRFLAYAEATGRGTLDDITRQDVIEWLNSLDARTSTKKAAERCIRVFFNRALAYGERTEPLPVIGYRGPSDTPRAVDKGFTAQELKSMAAKSRKLDTREGVIFHLVSRRPVRIAELVNLKVSDVDLENNTITLYRTKNRKTRMISIPKEAIEGMKILLTGKRREDPVFEAGARTMNNLVNGIVETLGVPRRGRSSHAFRHTVIVNMLRGLHQDPAVIAELAGNTVKTIYDHYDKMVSTDEVRMAEKQMDRLFNL